MVPQVLVNQPTVPSEGVSKVRVCGCGCWRWWQVTTGIFSLLFKQNKNVLVFFKLNLLLRLLTFMVVRGLWHLLDWLRIPLTWDTNELTLCYELINWTFLNFSLMGFSGGATVNSFSILKNLRVCISFVLLVLPCLYWHCTCGFVLNLSSSIGWWNASGVHHHHQPG